jgi:hypothetical protein
MTRWWLISALPASRRATSTTFTTNESRRLVCGVHGLPQRPTQANESQRRPRRTHMFEPLLTHTSRWHRLWVMG